MLREHLRPHGLLVRVGGDEFLCAMAGATRHGARLRFAPCARALGAAFDPIEIKAGFAVLSAQDSADALVRRADAELPTTPRRATG